MVAATKKGIRWSFVMKGALVGAAIYVPFVLYAQFYAKTHPDALAPATSTTTFQSLWGFSADHRTGNAELHSSNLRHFSAGFVGSLLYVHAFKSDSGYSVSLEAKHGVFSCGNDDDIYVSFDGGPQQAFTCHEAREDAEALVNGPVYLDAPDDFVARMNAAKTMSVQPLFVGDGRKEFEFSPP